MARAATLPILNGESGLSRYLAEIRKFPMLEPEQEYMLAKRYMHTFWLWSTRSRGRFWSGTRICRPICDFWRIRSKRRYDAGW